MRAQTSNPFRSGYRRMMFVVLAPGVAFLSGCFLYYCHIDYDRSTSGDTVRVVTVR